MPVSMEHKRRVLEHMERQAMGLKFTVETIGELRTAIAGLREDTPFQVICDGAEYRKLKVQAFHDREVDGFVRFEAVEQ